MVRRGSWILAVVVGASLGGCATPRAVPRHASTLPADSLRLLREALQLTRPGFATQEEALRAGVYQRSTSSPVPVLAAEDAARGELLHATAAYLIQIGAFPTLPAAHVAAAEAERRFPDLPIAIEAHGALYRVGLGEWASAASARDKLPTIRRHYPDAWVRRRTIS